MRSVPDPPRPVPIASPRDALLRKDDLLRFKPSDREAFEMGWNAGHARGVASVPPVTCECAAGAPVLAPPVPVAELLCPECASPLIWVNGRGGRHWLCVHCVHGYEASPVPAVAEATGDDDGH